MTIAATSFYDDTVTNTVTKL